LNAEIWLGTLSNADEGKDLALAGTVMGDSGARAYIKGIGLQWNTIDAVNTFATDYQIPVIQTEHKCGNYPWVMETFDSTQPANNHAYGVESWGYIRDWITRGVSSYSAWNMVLDTNGHNSD